MANRLYTKTEMTCNAIWLGSPTQAYRSGLVLEQAVEMEAGEIAFVVAEGEGSIYSYPFDHTSIFPFPMFATSQIVAYPPGATPPAITPCGDLQGGMSLTPGTGMDITQSVNYYTPQTKAAMFVAPTSGVWTFCMYWWGGSSNEAAGQGNAACVYPGSGRIQVLVLSSIETQPPAPEITLPTTVTLTLPVEWK